MIAWLAFYAGLSAVSLAAIRPMLRMPRLKVYATAVLDLDVPDTTFDHWGLV